MPKPYVRSPYPGQRLHSPRFYVHRINDTRSHRIVGRVPSFLFFEVGCTNLRPDRQSLQHIGSEVMQCGVRIPFLRRPVRSVAEALDSDGWPATGDIVTGDSDGYLTVIGRKKELTINASGKNMTPVTIEAAVKTSSSLIGEVVTIGDGRAFNTALVTLDAEAALDIARSPELAADPGVLTKDTRVLDLISATVGAGNLQLSRAEQVKRFRLVPTFWEPGSDELTSTMKLRRGPIAEKYAADIVASTTIRPLVVFSSRPPVRRSASLSPSPQRSRPARGPDPARPRPQW